MLRRTHHFIGTVKSETVLMVVACTVAAATFALNLIAVVVYNQDHYTMERIFQDRVANSIVSSLTGFACGYIVGAIWWYDRGKKTVD